MENIIEDQTAKAVNLSTSYNLIRRIETSRAKSNLSGKERYDFRKDVEAYLSVYILPLLSGTNLLNRKIYIAHPLKDNHEKMSLVRVQGIDEDGNVLFENGRETTSFYLNACCFIALEQLLKHLEPLCQ